MKKLTVIVTSALLLSLTACTSETAQQVFEKAIKNSLSADSVSMEMNIDMNVEASGMNMDMPMTVNMQMANMQDAAASIIHTESAVTVLGTESSAEAWIADGNIYIDAAGTKTVAAYSSVDLDKMLSIASYDSFDSCTLAKDNSDKVLTCTVNPDKISELMKGLLSGSADSAASELLSEMTFTIDHFIYRIDKDSNLKSLSFTAEAEGTVEGTEMALTMDASASYSDWNNTAVEKPDLTGFEDSTISSIAKPKEIALSDFKLDAGHVYNTVGIYTEAEDAAVAAEDIDLAMSIVFDDSSSAAMTINGAEEAASYVLSDTEFTLTDSTDTAFQIVPTETGFYILWEGMWLIFE